MADAAVESLLENLKQLVLYRGQLIGNATRELDKMEKDLLMFKSFLRESTIKKRRKDERLRELVREIRDVVYEAEDIIDAFVTQAVDAKTKDYFATAFRKPVDLLAIAEEVAAVASKIKDMYGEISRSTRDFAFLSFGVDESPDEAPVIRQENVVGLEDEAMTLTGYLLEETTKLDVISIVGMPGLGKSALTTAIFRDPEIEYRFPTRIWVYVSQEFSRKRVFLDILSNFPGLITDDMSQKTDQELAHLVCSYLRRGNFLLVLDDVWATDDWDKLKIAFPRTVNMGKIVITSRLEEVGMYANPDRYPHYLRLLTHEEGWLLLRCEVFGKPDDFPPELEGPGKIIVNRCGRLPLALVIIGGILAQKTNRGDIGATKTAWIKVCETVSAELNTTKGMEDIIALSYDKLPYHLRSCFLYLGIFPEDFVIPAWKLICMWIAEGFIQQQDGTSLEETAETYLEELINRNLLRVDKRKQDGKVKTCRIHNMLREFCRYESGGERENFLQEVKMTTEGKFNPASIHKCRRLCIHPRLLKSFFLSSPYGPCVRSFVCFSEDEMDFPVKNISAIPAAFKLLRVLDVKPIKFPKLPSDLYQLVHLRYIVLSFNLSFLPPAFSKLWNIQTLIVNTTSRTLEVKADIWNLMHLTHFKTNAPAILPQPEKSSEAGDKIQTLSIISPQSCTKKVFDQARNLKKLSICGQLALIFDLKYGSFDSLGKLGSLENLKLINDVHPNPPFDGKLYSLPSPYQFPPKLRRLTLSTTFLHWTHMRILGLLENLEVLKLKDKAFTGNIWKVVDGGFRHLEFLYIERSDLACWAATEHSFPRLRSLELRNCDELQEIPIDFADIPTFKILNLHYTEHAARSARRIREEKHRQQDEKIAKTGGFKLSIFPAYAPYS